MHKTWNLVVFYRKNLSMIYTFFIVDLFESVFLPESLQKWKIYLPLTWDSSTAYPCISSVGRKWCRCLLSLVSLVRSRTAAAAYNAAAALMMLPQPRHLLQPVFVLRPPHVLLGLPSSHAHVLDPCHQ